MARKKSGWPANLKKVPLHAGIDLGALATKDATKGVIANTSADTYRWKSIKCTVSITDLVAGDGPIVVGVSHPDYSSTEIEECLEAVASIDQGDKIAREQANRLVRTLGVVNETDMTINQGRPVHQKLNWLMSIGDQPTVWAYNSGTVLLSTGARVHLDGSILVQFQ